MIRAFLFSYIRDFLTSSSKLGFFSRSIKKVLFFFSLVYSLGIFLRNFLYDRKILKVKKVDQIVISIGNIVAGGVGKTPFTIFLGSELLQHGRVTVLTRGYLSKVERENKNVKISFKEGANVGWEEIGDEAKLICEKLKSCQVIVGRDRIFSAQDANGTFILLDDGLQYRALFRDFEIIMLNGGDLFGGGYFLPRGFLRDSPKVLKRADLIVINMVASKHQFLRLKGKIAPYSTAPIIGMRPVFRGFRDLENRRVDLDRNTKVGIFCAIGNPSSFYQLVKGYSHVVDKLYLADHEKLSVEKMVSFFEKIEAKGGKFLICTEKDKVKLGKKFPFCLYVDMALEIVEGEEHWKKLVAKIVGKVDN